MTTKRILIVDDNPNIIKLLSYFLKGTEYSIDSALNGKEALENINKKKPSLIFLDLLMPELDGFSFAQRLHEQKLNIPTIVLTSKEVTQEEDSYLKDIGIIKCLNKEKMNQKVILDLVKKYTGG